MGYLAAALWRCPGRCGAVASDRAQKIALICGAVPQGSFVGLHLSVTGCFWNDPLKDLFAPFTSARCPAGGWLSAPKPKAPETTNQWRGSGSLCWLTWAPSCWG